MMLAHKYLFPLLVKHCSQGCDTASMAHFLILQEGDIVLFTLKELRGFIPFGTLAAEFVI